MRRREAEHTALGTQRQGIHPSHAGGAPITRRRAGVGISSIAASALLAACGAQAGTTGGQGAPGAQSGRSAKPAAGAVTWLVRPQQIEQDWQDKVALPRMKELFPQIDVQREIGPGGSTGWPDKIFAMHAAGTPPDVHNGNVGTFIQLYAQGKVAELGPLAARDRFDVKAFGGFEKDQDMCRSGKQWSLPVLTTMGMMIFYNTSLLEQAGVTPPPAQWSDKTWTVDKLLEAARKATKNAGQPDATYGIQPLGGNAYHQYPYLWGADPFPKEFYTQGLAQATSWNTAGVVESIQWYADLSLRHRVSVKRGDPSKPFREGGMAFWMTQGWSVQDLRDVSIFKWGMAPLPWKTSNKSLSFTDGVLISKDTKTLDASWELVKYLTGRDGQIEYSRATGRPPTRADAFDFWLDETLKLPGIVIKSKDQLRAVATGYLGNHVDNWAHYVVNASPLQTIMSETETKFLTGELGVPAALGEMKQRMEAQLRDTHEQFKSSPLVRDTPC